MSGTEPTELGGAASAAGVWRARLGSVGLGTAQLGNLFSAMPDEVAEQTLAAAWDRGVQYFDTAPHYGLGLAEQRLGRFLAGRPRHGFVVSTKAGRRLVPSPETADRFDDDLYQVPAVTRRVWDFTEAGIRAELDDSLARLGLDHLDILYLHDPERYDLGEALRTGVPAAIRLRDEGLVRAIGIGSMRLEAIRQAVRTGALDVVMIAGRYTLLERYGAADLLEECADRGVAVIAAAVFNSGLLSTSHVAAGAKYEYQDATAEVLERARALAALCADHGVELPAAALQFPLRHPAVATVVAGAATAGHVRQNIARLTVGIPDALWTGLPEQESIVD
jgi:D-threo-aldose 1-dehydrogenase